jgi:mannosyltransferase
VTPATIAPSRRALSDLRPRLDSRYAIPLALLAIAGLSLWLRTRRLDAPLWIDEGLSVGIASHDLGEIPGILRRDGSPPLYYVMLHGWIQLFGTSETALQSLSLVFALAMVPVAYWAGRSLFGTNAGLVCALLFATNTYITRHGQEARMYALMALLALVATAAFVQAFGARRRGYLPLFAVVLAVMLYTHNWAIFFAAGTVAALAFLVREAGGDERRALLRDAVLAFGGALLLYAPWLPTLAYQVEHTGAPWAESPNIKSAQKLTVAMLGGYGPSVALLLGAGTGIAAAFAARARERRLLAAVLAIGGGALAAAWLANQVSPAWADRYFAIFVAPVLLAAGAGIARAGKLGLVALVLVLLFWAQPREYSSSSISERKVIGDVAAYLRPGDLAIATHPERLPVIHYYMPEGMRYANLLGPVDDPAVMDWRDVLDRLREAKPRRTLSPLLDRVPVGTRVVIVRPLIRTSAGWEASWTKLVRQRSRQWGRLLATDRRFVRVVDAPRPLGTVLGGVRAEVYAKTRAN